MKTPHEVNITTRDCVFRAWENSMEMVRDFQRYARDCEDRDTARTFAAFAEEEALHAAAFRDMLHVYDRHAHARQHGFL